MKIMKKKTIKFCFSLSLGSGRGRREEMEQRGRKAVNKKRGCPNSLYHFNILCLSVLSVLLVGYQLTFWPFFNHRNLYNTNHYHISSLKTVLKWPYSYKVRLMILTVIKSALINFWFEGILVTGNAVSCCLEW